MDQGYDGASLRDIAACAGVDAALINRYFGGKDGLFSLVVSEACNPGKLTQGDRVQFGRHFADSFLSSPNLEDGDGLESVLLMLRAAMTPASGRLVRTTLEEQFMAPFAAWLGGADARVRAQLICACLTGLAVNGRIWRETLSAEEERAFADRLAAILQALVDG